MATSESLAGKLPASSQSGLDANCRCFSQFTKETHSC